MEKEVMDDAASYREQRPYVKVFRKFIRDPDNTNEKGLPWTPAVLLEQFWELWPDRPPERGAYTQFCEKYRQRIERLRADSPKLAIRDPLLFLLIKRFLEAREIYVPSARVIDGIKAIQTSLWTIIPSSKLLPSLETPQSEAEIQVYNISHQSSEWRGAQKVFIALRKQGKKTASSPAIVFEHGHMEMKVGLYFHATRECFARNPNDFEFYKYSFSRELQTGDPTAAESGKRLGEFEKLQEGYGVVYQMLCNARISNDKQALKFAENYLKNFS